jgi:antitoxin component HigA of HigAB toxin-antitoxin module
MLEQSMYLERNMTYIERIVNADQTITEKPYTDEQLAEMAIWVTEAEEKAAADQAIESAKAAAQAKLSALGLTTDDLKALGL